MKKCFVKAVEEDYIDHPRYPFHKSVSGTFPETESGQGATELGQVATESRDETEKFDVSTSQVDFSPSSALQGLTSTVSPSSKKIDEYKIRTEKDLELKRVEKPLLPEPQTNPLGRSLIIGEKSQVSSDFTSNEMKLFKQFQIRMVSPEHLYYPLLVCIDGQCKTTITPSTASAHLTRHGYYVKKNNEVQALFQKLKNEKGVYNESLHDVPIPDVKVIAIPELYVYNLSKAYTCKLCNASCQNAQTFQKHIKNRHKGKLSADYRQYMTETSGYFQRYMTKGRFFAVEIPKNAQEIKQEESRKKLHDYLAESRASHVENLQDPLQNPNEQPILLRMTGWDKCLGDYIKTVDGVNMLMKLKKIDRKNDPFDSKLYNALEIYMSAVPGNILKAGIEVSKMLQGYDPHKGYAQMFQAITSKGGIGHYLNTILTFLTVCIRSLEDSKLAFKLPLNSLESDTVSRLRKAIKSDEQDISDPLHQALLVLFSEHQDMEQGSEDNYRKVKVLKKNQQDEIVEESSEEDDTKNRSAGAKDEQDDWDDKNSDVETEEGSDDIESETEVDKETRNKSVGAEDEQDDWDDKNSDVETEDGSDDIESETEVDKETRNKSVGAEDEQDDWDDKNSDVETEDGSDDIESETEVDEDFDEDMDIANDEKKLMEEFLTDPQKFSQPIESFFALYHLQSNGTFRQAENVTQSFAHVKYMSKAIVLSEALKQSKGSRSKATR
ncbi:hypothetical protein VKT23_020208 [Stygiomarasmius scandens]|uniref:C2H2-type domain-containing protein n=1 Tax=Marasmiellus scandens TaxID=2682957 RepID=A0ABR1IM78_9AGAR